MEQRTIQFVLQDKKNEYLSRIKTTATGHELKTHPSMQEAIIFRTFLEAKSFKESPFRKQSLKDFTVTSVEVHL